MGSIFIYHHFIFEFLKGNKHMKRINLIKSITTLTIGAGIVSAAAISITSCNNTKQFGDFNITGISPMQYIKNGYTSDLQIVLHIDNYAEISGGTISFALVDNERPDLITITPDTSLLNIKVGLTPGITRFSIAATESKSGYDTKTVTQAFAIDLAEGKKIDGSD
jgi:hypothetical protein